MQGKLIFTDPTHVRAERPLFRSPSRNGISHLRVADSSFTGFDGFGVAITPSSCYELSLMDSEERKDLLTHLYTKEGLGLSVARVCIGSSDYSPELYSYDDVAMDTELTHFSVKRDEAYVIPIIKEILEINPDLFLFASPWSPPYWMKTGNSMCGGFMRREFLECYARYFVKFILAYAAYGIKISAVTPQNEPNTAQKSTMPACIWHPELEAEFVKILRSKLDKERLDVKIWLYDHNFSDTQARVLWMLEASDGLAEACDGVAFHYYGGRIEQTSEVTERFPSLSLHFTEGGPRLTDHYDTDWCKWGLMTVKALKLGYRSFTGWNLMLDETGGPNIGPFLGICGGLVTRDSQSGELRYSGQYKAFSHLSPYVTPTSVIRPISADCFFEPEIYKYPKCDRPVEGIFIEDETRGTRVAVLVNPNPHGVQTELEVDGEIWYAELSADSISTLILK